MKEKVINRAVGKDWLVSIQGKRARVIRNWSEPVEITDMAPGVPFLPGRLLQPAESVPYLRGLK